VKLPAIFAIAVASGGAAGYAIASPETAEPPEPIGPGTVTVVVDVEHSRFEPDYLRLVEGTTVRFVVSNDDPINHELIVGPQSIHDRHRDGTEAEHPPRPGEISVGPDEQGVTRYTFDTPGTIEIACHLPGHYDYGMRGEVEVVPAE
jgi:uncharacterized cupredoxin-like copper-binding protein